MYLFSASINPAWIQGGMSILTMSVVQGTSDLLQCGPGMCLADTQIMPGFPQSRNSWITKDRPFSFVTTFLVPGKHPLISPWLLLKAESTQTVGQGLQEGKKLYSFPISTCGCCLVAEDKSEVSVFQCHCVNPHCYCVPVRQLNPWQTADPKFVLQLGKCLNPNSVVV